MFKKIMLSMLIAGSTGSAFGMNPESKTWAPDGHWLSVDVEQGFNKHVIHDAFISKLKQIERSEDAQIRRFIFSHEHLQATQIQAFIEAAKRGDLDFVTNQIARRFEIVNATDENGYTALMRAAEHNHTQVAQVLIAAGAEVNVATVNGADSVEGPALLLALYRNRPEEMDIEMVRAIVSAPGFYPVAHNQAERAIDIVMQSGRTDIAAVIQSYLR